MPPLVSIIIPVHNAEIWIEETIQSAIDQTWDNKEIIIVDDGSTDKSVDIIRKCTSSNVKLINQNHKGGSAARNKGLEQARGDYIQYLDADDIISKNKIEVQISRLINESPKTIAASPWVTFAGHIENSKINPKKGWRDYDNPVDWLIEADLIGFFNPSHAWLTPVELVRVAGPWDETLIRSQDGEYFSRVLLNAEKVVFTTGCMSYYRRDNTKSVSKINKRESIMSVLNSIKNQTRNILNYENNERTRLSCATRYLRFIYNTYPIHMDLVVEAENEMKLLGGANYCAIGGKIFNLIRYCAGLRAALYLRYILKKWA